MLFEVKNLFVKYHNRFALKDISFGVREGEFLGILGPNGSGKSTLLKCLAGIIVPFCGDVRLFDEPVLRFDRKRRAKLVSYVPQDGNFFLDFTCYEVVLLGRTPYLKGFQLESSEDHRKVEEAMKMTDCLHFKERSIFEISGGERQRVVIARALAQEPSVLLLDEPMAHLDFNHQVEILNLLRSLSKMEKRITVIVALHDLNLASEYCDRGVLLKDGEIKKIGGIDEIMEENILLEVYGQSAGVGMSPVSGKKHVFLNPNIKKQKI